jgi:hypothetical protein
MKKNLHLTHTEIKSDSRILKEMGTLAVAGYAQSGLGVTLDEGSKRSIIDFDADISSIELKSRQWTFLPRTLRHIVSLFELIAKMLPNAICKKLVRGRGQLGYRDEQAWSKVSERTRCFRNTRSVDPRVWADMDF